MALVQSPPQLDTPAEAASPSSPPRVPARLVTAGVWATYVLGAFYITARLWKDIDHRITASNPLDYSFFQFVLSHAAHSLATLGNPLFNAELNAPHGVNMMANTSMLGLSLPLAPVTLWWGPKPAFALALVIGLAGTAIAWYHFMRRHITTNRPIAFVAAGFCGFSPGLVSQANGHPNLVAQFMVPLIISRVLQLRDTARWRRHGTILGLMIVYQMFLNEEILLYTALVCALMVVVHGLTDRTAIRAFFPGYLRGLALAALIVTGLMAYPLWFQFLGPQHYTGPFGWAGEYGMDLAAFTGYASESIGGRSGWTNPLAPNPAEENAFYGWPLCVLAIGFGVIFWRVMAVRTAVVVGASLTVLSLGDEIRVNTRDTGVPGPWKAVSDLPLFDAIIVTRLAMGAAVAIAVILAVAMTELVRTLSTLDIRTRGPLWALTACALAAALVPVFPTPLPATGQRPVPAFFTQGLWREHVDDGTVVPVPPVPWSGESLDWLVASGMRMPVADGYFLGPTDEHNTRASFGAPQRYTGELLRRVAASGREPRIAQWQRNQVLADLRYWRADVMVLPPHPNQGDLRRTVNQILGFSGVGVGGVWVWDVRNLPA